MICCKEIDEYLQFCKDNPHKINSDRKLLIKNIVEPLLKREDIFFDEVTYQKCLKFCQRWYYELFPYQKFIYAFVFMYEDNKPLFRTFFIMMGRGNGKDGMMAPLMHFLTSQYYGIKNYNIDIVATAEDQCKDTYNIIYETEENNKIMFKKYFYWNKEESINLITKAKIRYNTSNAKTKDGKKDGAILFNEFHAYVTYEQIKVFQSGLGKIPHARIFIITTNGYVREGPLDDTLNVCEGILNGEANQLRYFPFICRIDKEEEADNPECWEKANPSMPFKEDLRDAIMIDYLEIKKFPSKKPEFMTKRMNIASRKEDETVTSWSNILKACYSDEKKKIERVTPKLEGKKAVVGIDFASLNDFATAGFLFKEGNEYIWRSKTWICSNGKFYNDIKFPLENQGMKGYEDFEVVHTNSIDENLLIDWVLDNLANYNIKKIVLDMYRFKLIRKGFEERGISVEEKNNPEGLVRMLRHPDSIYAIVAPRIETEFANGNINLGDSAIMRWAINNTAVKNLKNGNKTYEKIEPKLRKNDPFMAFVAAMSAEELLKEEIIYVYV